MENIVEGPDGKKYRLMAVDPAIPEKVVEDAPIEELDPSIPVFKAQPKTKTAVEMFQEQVERKARSNVERLISDSKLNRRYKKDIAKETSNSKFFYGEGVDDISSERDILDE